MKKFSKGKKIGVACMAVAALLSVGLLATNMYNSSASAPVSTGATSYSNTKGCLSDKYAAVILQQTVYNYTGKLIQPKPDVYYKGKKLVENEDYVLDYSGPAIKKGVYNVAVKGIGNMKGASYVQFKVVDAGTVTEVPAIPVIDESVDYAEVNSTVYLDKQCEVKLTQTEFKYTGNEVKPIPVVTYKGKPLKPYVDYKVNYPVATNTGSHYITVTGMGNVVGQKNLTFKITK